MFKLILNRFDYAARERAEILSADELVAWPQGDVAVLKRLKLLKKAAPAKIIECPGCEESCLMPVNVYPAQDGRPARIFIACDKREDTGRVLIESADLEQWQIDICRFAFLLASALGTGHAPDEIIPQQAFYLGALTINRKRRSAIFVANNESLNLALESGLVEQYLHPFFLVAASLPGPQGVKQGPAILPLHQLLMFPENSTLSLDMEALEHLITLDDNQNVEAFVPKTSGAKENVFRKKGQKWVISFNGSEDIFCNDNKGFLFISYLLGYPGREIHCQQLRVSATGRAVEDAVGFGGVSSSESKDQKQSGNGQHQTEVQPQNPLLDEKALKEYKSHAQKLRQLIEQAKTERDFARKERYEKEYEILRKEIIAASKLGGGSRGMADDAEKARKSVSEAVRRAMKIIEKKHPDLFLHLKNTISLGEYCLYNPEEEISWKTQ